MTIHELIERWAGLDGKHPRTGRETGEYIALTMMITLVKEVGPIEEVLQSNLAEKWAEQAANIVLYGTPVVD